MDDIAFPFWIQRKLSTRGGRAADWETLADFQTRDEAQLALADSDRFPLDRPLRIIEVKVVL